MAKNTIEQYKKLLELMRYTIEQDDELRNSFQIADKFRFIRDRLHFLQKQIEGQVNQQQQKNIEEITLHTVAEDEIEVFVYLYNAQGRATASWKNMLKPGNLYEYSVNRPIYLAKADIESHIRSKIDKSQHGFIILAVKKNDIVLTPSPLKDAMNHPLVKVKEGALHFERFLGFVHNGIEYMLDANGNLIKKDG